MIASSDDLKEAQEKMEEWMENGCRLAWLIFPKEEKGFIYEPGQAVEERQKFNQKLKGSQLLQGFVLDLSLLK